MMEKKKSVGVLSTIIGFGLIIMLLLTKEIFYLVLLGLSLTVYLLHYLASKNPNSYWVQLLFGSRGPRTDTKYMTKKELFRSGVQYLMWSAYIFIILLILVIIENKFGNRAEPPILFLVLLFVIFFLFMISIGTGLYLLFRGVMRRKNYIPAENTKEQF